VAGQGPEGRGVQPGAGAPCIECQVLSLTPDGLPVLPASLEGVRLAIRTLPAAEGWPAALADVGQRGARAGLHVTGVPGEDDPLLDAADLLIVEPAVPRDPALVTGLVFELKRALSAARGRRPSARLLVAAPGPLVRDLEARGLAAYVDGFLDPPARIEAVADLFDESTGNERLRVVTRDPGAAAAILRAAAATAAWFPSGLVPAAGQRLQCGTDRPIRTFLNPFTLDLVGVSRACPAPARVSADVPDAVAERLDLDGVSIFRVAQASGERFAEGVTVAAARTLTAAEIIARHQAAAR